MYGAVAEGHSGELGAGEVKDRYAAELSESEKLIFRDMFPDFLGANDGSSKTG